MIAYFAKFRTKGAVLAAIKRLHMYFPGVADLFQPAMDFPKQPDLLQLDRTCVIPGWFRLAA